MKKLSTLLLLLLSHFCFSQNLVPNWSFEDTVSCPNDVDQIDRAVGWSSYKLTPDYFNSCNPDTGGAYPVGVPSNFAGYEEALNGNAYAGLVTFYSFSPTDREYIGSQLITPLVIGQKYFVSFYVSRAASNFYYVNIATNKLGIQFFTFPYSAINPVPIDNHAQVFTDSIITDTLNWVKISGSFIADSAYSYISLGNFFTDSLTTHISFDTTAAFSYYYIDCIKVSTDSNYVNAITEYSSTNPIKVFPNPARDWISIWGNDVQSLMLFDVLGRIVYMTNSVFISPLKINTSSFPKGMYYLKIQTRTKSISQKIIFE